MKLTASSYTARLTASSFPSLAPPIYHSQHVNQTLPSSCQPRATSWPLPLNNLLKHSPTYMYQTTAKEWIYISTFCKLDWLSWVLSIIFIATYRNDTTNANQNILPEIKISTVFLIRRHTDCAYIHKHEIKCLCSKENEIQEWGRIVGISCLEGKHEVR